MNDRELLEMAAKAAGFVSSRIDERGWFCVSAVPNEWELWNPLTDDGDALRLAVALHLELLVEKSTTCAVKRGQAFARVRHESDPYAATRRAIVRAAAEIGRTM